MRRSSTRYNQVRQKSIHNAYQREQEIPEQVERWAVRSLELDLHGFGSDWKVYHWLLDNESSIDRLSDGLALLRRLRRPSRDAITVFLDLKTPFSGQRVSGRGTQRTRPGRHTARRLDALVRKHFPAAMLFTPGDLRAADPEAPSLQAVAGVPEAWPTLHHLRGRFLFVLTGPKVRLDHYRKSSEDPVAFIAPRIARTSEIETHRHAVFFNLADAKARSRAGRQLLSRGLVSRSYGLDTREDWQHALGAGIHHLATDMVNDREHRWASTRHGSAPFQII